MIISKKEIENERKRDNEERRKNAEMQRLFLQQSEYHHRLQRSYQKSLNNGSRVG